MASRIQKVLQTLEEISPLNIAQTTWDNVGLLIEAHEPTNYPTRPKIVVAIDLTSRVMDEVEKHHPECHFIVAYHPPLFNKIRRITNEDVKSSIAIRCISKNISVYSPHTALDNCKGGINEWLAAGLPGTTKPLDIIKDAPIGHEGIGYGQIVTLDAPTSLDDVVSLIKSRLTLSQVRVARGFTEKQVSTIAICAGSGASLLMENGKPRADVVWTGEMSHHEVLACVEDGSSVVLCEHTNTERPFLKVYCERIQASLPDWQVVQSIVDEDPLKIV
jgi:dinuclear metal center YbgI/SA1388 family protein